MADGHGPRDYAYRERDEEHRQSQYPPLGDDGRARPHDSGPGGPVSLPPLTHAMAHHYHERPESGYGASSPANGYPAHQSQPPMHHAPPRPPADPRSPAYPPGHVVSRDDPYGQRGSYYPPPPSAPVHGPGDYPPPHGYHGQPNGYAPGGPPNGYRDYGRHPAGYEQQDYASGPPMGQQQSIAPRQRTSIACKYCRKRKIRCSGFSNGPKCSNCQRMNQECVFQPVSSSSQQTFYRVGPEGPPPGTPLYGAYGQPIGQGQPAPSPGGPPGTYALAPGHGPPPPPGAPPIPQQASHYYPQPLHSPTEVQSPYGAPRSADGRGSFSTGRRRRRESEEAEDSRLPPPGRGPEDGSRRRSPMSSHSSPGNYPPYPGRDESWQARSGHAAPSSASQSSYASYGPYPQDSNATAAEGRSPVGSRGSGSISPPRTAASSQPTASSVMSVSNLLDQPRNDVDRKMLDRLDRRPER